MENFFSTLKSESPSKKHYRTRDDLRADVFHYIEWFYNPRRRHSTIGYISPVQFKKPKMRLTGVSVTMGSAKCRSCQQEPVTNSRLLVMSEPLPETAQVVILGDPSCANDSVKHLQGVTAIFAGKVRRR
jgi:hypothetical protein